MIKIRALKKKDIKQASKIVGLNYSKKYEKLAMKEIGLMFKNKYMSPEYIVAEDKGKIIEKGTHQSLITKKGIYSTLWKEQSKE